jgi:hypothetical protein
MNRPVKSAKPPACTENPRRISYTHALQVIRHLKTVKKKL